jgi:hypothetical protein
MKLSDVEVPAFACGYGACKEIFYNNLTLLTHYYCIHQQPQPQQLEANNGTGFLFNSSLSSSTSKEESLSALNSTTKIATVHSESPHSVEIDNAKAGLTTTILMDERKQEKPNSFMEVVVGGERYSSRRWKSLMVRNVAANPGASSYSI